MPFFRMLKGEVFADADMTEDNISALVALTLDIFQAVERELKLASFWESVPARNKLKAEIQRILLSPDFNKLPHLVINRTQIISRIMEIAEKNNDRILFAD